MLLVGPGFLLVYTAANLYTAHLPPERVGEIGMAWERAIPFLPWTILPYLSIDLLYVVSPFVCRSRRELRVHVLRFAVATAFALACFMLFPLRFGFARPETSGLPDLLFRLLGTVDHPYNQAPSLHVALLVILWDCYRKHLQPRWRWLLHLGLVAITASVLTTWQHHFLDVPSGLALGIVVCLLIPQAAIEEPIRGVP
ncbi:MAG: serine/threonine protein phosphatase [Nevskia sp.]|nr:serine/threonine protein phosphatase [Nevskia sp.]